MLKHTLVNFELLTDIYMVILYLSSAIYAAILVNVSADTRESITNICSQSVEIFYLMYFDINNLYGWVMCQPLPYAKFQ